VSEAIADDPVQADPLFRSSEGQLAMEGLRNLPENRRSEIGSGIGSRAACEEDSGDEEDHDLGLLLCQYCGRVAEDNAENNATWLVELHAKLPSIYVIRCPHHISEWALRATKVGRTKEMREKARRGREMDLPPVTRFDRATWDFKGAGDRKRKLD